MTERVGAISRTVERRLTANERVLHYALQPLERLAQLVIVPVVKAALEVKDFEASARGANGFGSSGRH